MVLPPQWLEVDWMLCPYLPESLYEKERLSPEYTAMTAG